MPLLRMKFERVGRAAAPTRKNDSAYRPSSGRFAATFPQGKAFFALLERILIQNDAPEGKFPSGRLVVGRSGRGESDPLRTMRN